MEPLAASPRLSLLLGVIRALVGRGVGAAGQLAVTMVLGRLYGADGTGAIMLGLTAMLVLSLIGRLGLDFALLRIASQAWEQRDQPRLWSALFAATRIALVGSLVLAASLLLLTPWLAVGVFGDPRLTGVLPWFAAAIPAYALLSLWCEAHKAIDRPGAGNFLHTAAIPVGFLLMQALLYWGDARTNPSGIDHAAIRGAQEADGQPHWTTLPMASAAYAVAVWSAAGCALVSLTRAAGPWRLGPSDDWKAMRTAGMPLLVFSLFSMAGSWLPLLLLGCFADSQAVGQFGAAARLAILIMFILLACNSVIPARFARLHASGDLAAIRRLAGNSSLLMTLIALPLALLMIFFGDFFLGWLGSDFQAASGALAILAAAQLVNVATGSVGYLLIMTGHEQQLRRAGIFGFFVNLVGCLCWIPHWGILGAAWAAALAIVTENLTATWLAYRQIGIVCLPWLPGAAALFARSRSTSPTATGDAHG